ncbi:MAG: porin [Deltaproteobacteria bacterium]|nr:porin [Deltaproteobacteria bacterium]
MTLHRILATLPAAALLLAGGAASAQTAEEKLAAEVTKLRQEVEQLKGRADEADVRARDAVVLGDIPGSFRLPGTDLSLRLYGFVELDWVHAFRGDNSDIDYSTFAPYLPINGSPQARKTNRDYLDVRASRLGLETAYPTRFGVLQTKIEGDFNNEPRTGNAAVYGSDRNVFTQQQTNSYGFRVRHAYGAFAGLLVGQTWSTFMDVDNSPETLDYNGPIGSTFIRQPQIRYTYGTPDYGSFTVALENSSSYALDETGAALASSHSRLPDLVVRWDKGFGWGSMSIRGVTQETRVDDGASVGQARGWGAGGTVFVKTRGNQDFLSVAVTYGDGIGRYFNYVEGAAFDSAGRKVLLERALGIVAGYQYKVSPELRFNLVYGFQQNFDNGYTDFARANGLDSGRFGVNRMVQQGHFGPIFTPVKGVDIGVEGIWADRKTLAAEHGEDIRLNFMAKYYIN